MVEEKSAPWCDWVREKMLMALSEEETTIAAAEYVYKQFYLQVDLLSDSVFFEEIAERIHDMPRQLGGERGRERYDDDKEEGYEAVLSDMGNKMMELRDFEPGIQEERRFVQSKHDAICTTYQRNYDTKLRIERKKREIFYHVQGRLSDCQTAIVTATTRGGYPVHKGGQTALREELRERRVEVNRRQDRRDRRVKVFEAKRDEILTVKKEADFIMEMDDGEVKEEKRLSPIHVDDAKRSKIAMAVIAMATFQQIAGIPKKKRKKAGSEMANEAKRIMKDQNVVRLQRNAVMLVNVTGE